MLAELLDLHDLPRIVQPGNFGLFQRLKGACSAFLAQPGHFQAGRD